MIKYRWFLLELNYYITLVEVVIHYTWQVITENFHYRMRVEKNQKCWRSKELGRFIIIPNCCNITINFHTICGKINFKLVIWHLNGEEGKSVLQRRSNEKNIYLLIYWSDIDLRLGLKIFQCICMGCNLLLQEEY